MLKRNGFIFRLLLFNVKTFECKKLTSRVMIIHISRFPTQINHFFRVQTNPAYGAQKTGPIFSPEQQWATLPDWLFWLWKTAFFGFFSKLVTLFRNGGGYKELWQKLTRHKENSSSQDPFFHLLLKREVIEIL